MPDADAPITIRLQLHRAALVALLLLVAVLVLGTAFAAHAQDALDPADAAVAAVDGVLATPPAPDAPAKPAIDPAVLLAIAAGLGVALRVGVIPLLKLVLPGFKRVPVVVQHLMIVALSAGAGFLEAFGAGVGVAEALAAGLTIYLSSQAAFHATKSKVEHRARRAPAPGSRR